MPHVLVFVGLLMINVAIFPALDKEVWRLICVDIGLALYVGATIALNR